MLPLPKPRLPGMGAPALSPAIATPTPSPRAPIAGGPGNTQMRQGMPNYGALPGMAGSVGMKANGIVTPSPLYQGRSGPVSPLSGSMGRPPTQGGQYGGTTQQPRPQFGPGTQGGTGITFGGGGMPPPAPGVRPGQQGPGGIGSGGQTTPAQGAAPGTQGPGGFGGQAARTPSGGLPLMQGAGQVQGLQRGQLSQGPSAQGIQSSQGRAGGQGQFGSEGLLPGGTSGQPGVRGLNIPVKPISGRVVPPSRGGGTNVTVGTMPSRAGGGTGYNPTGKPRSPVTGMEGFGANATPIAPTKGSTTPVRQPSGMVDGVVAPLAGFPTAKPTTTNPNDPSWLTNANATATADAETQANPSGPMFPMPPKPPDALTPPSQPLPGQQPTGESGIGAIDSPYPGAGSTNPNTGNIFEQPLYSGGQNTGPLQGGPLRGVAPADVEGAYVGTEYGSSSGYGETPGTPIGSGLPPMGGGSGDALGEVGEAPPAGGTTPITKDTPPWGSSGGPYPTNGSGSPSGSGGGGYPGSLPPVGSGGGTYGGSGGGSGGTSGGTGTGGSGGGDYPPWGSSGGPYPTQPAQPPPGGTLPNPSPGSPPTQPSPGTPPPPNYPPQVTPPSLPPSQPPPPPYYPPAPTGSGNNLIYQAPQSVGSEGYSVSQGQSGGTDTSHSQSQGTQSSTAQSTSGGTATSNNQSQSAGSSSSNPFQSMSFEDAMAILGGGPAREGVAENPFSRQQFDEERNRENSQIGAQAQAQLEDLMAKAKMQGMDPNSPAILAARQQILQKRGAAELANTSKQDAAFRQKSGAFDQANAAQNIQQRAQDLQKLGMNQSIINALLGQQTSTGQNQSTSLGTSQSQNAAQSTSQSQGQQTSFSDSNGQRWQWNNSISQWQPVFAG